MEEQLDKQLVDEAMEAYVDWREECAAVWDAYERWARAHKIDAAGAFAAYRGALDREECASHAYADLLGIEGGKGPIGDLFGRAVQRLAGDTSGYGRSCATLDQAPQPSIDE